MQLKKFLLTRPLRDVTVKDAGNSVFMRFLLTRPLRDVTTLKLFILIGTGISTHTPLAGRDLKTETGKKNYMRFLLTRPLRDVTGSGCIRICSRIFLLTRPLRDVTSRSEDDGKSGEFLLTRPLRDVTNALQKVLPALKFLLTRPLRDVTIYRIPCAGNIRISTHTPLAGRDYSRISSLA